MIQYNYHTHTRRCHHAEGTEREYIEKAIRAGIRELGFSDHCPVPFENGYVSPVRMTMDEAPEYFSTIRSLAEEYRDRLEIRCGFEMEYTPDLFERQIRFYESLGCDYLILGQHYAGREDIGPYVGRKTDDPWILTRYVDLVLEGASTGKFLYVAHPDVCWFEGDNEIYRRECERLCGGLLQMDIPIEINGLGMATSRNYPNESFWRIAGEVGNTVVIGMDAHTPDQLADEAVWGKCRDLAEKCNVRLTDKKLL